MPIYKNIDVNLHFDDKTIKLLLQELKSINLKLTKMATSIKDLSDKVDALQTDLDAEQEKIAAAIAKLQQTISDLKSGGTPQEIQAVADKIDSVITDLQGTTLPEDTP